MKSTKCDGVDNNCDPYPKLMTYKHEKDYLIVLFNKLNCGMVVSATSKSDPVGEYRTTWSEWNFVKYNGTITLSN